MHISSQVTGSESQQTATTTAETVEIIDTDNDYNIEPEYSQTDSKNDLKRYSSQDSEQSAHKTTRSRSSNDMPSLQIPTWDPSHSTLLQADSSPDLAFFQRVKSTDTVESTSSRRKRVSTFKDRREFHAPSPVTTTDTAQPCLSGRVRTYSDWSQPSASPHHVLPPDECSNHTQVGVYEGARMMAQSPITGLSEVMNTLHVHSAKRSNSVKGTSLPHSSSNQSLKSLSQDTSSDSVGFKPSSSSVFQSISWRVSYIASSFLHTFVCLYALVLPIFLFIRMMVPAPARQVSIPRHTTPLDHSHTAEGAR